MIGLDPFYFLLLLELLLVQTALIILLYFKGRSLKASYLKSVKIPVDFIPQEDPFPVKETLIPAPASSEKADSPDILNEEVEMKEIGGVEETGIGDEEVKRLRNTVGEKAEIILKMKKKIEEMEKKFADMEKEYLILFDQSQKQEEALRQYELRL
jgi:hypothetical protein